MNNQKLTTIELKESQAKIGLDDELNNLVNGEYEVKLQNALTLRNGDSVQLKSAFIDSLSSGAGKINIPIDQPITIGVYHYIQNDSSAGKTYNQTYATANPQPDGNEYFLCDHTTTNNPNLKRITSFEVFLVDNYGSRYWGDCAMVYEYKDMIGSKQTFTFNIPKIKGKNESYSVPSSVFGGSDIGVNEIIFDSTGGFNLVSPSQKDLGEKYSINAGKIEIGSIAYNLGASYIPHEFQHNFTIPRGEYDPDELARFITDKMSKISVNNAPLNTYPIDSPYLTTTAQFNSKFPQVGGVRYCGNTGEDFFIYNAGSGDHYSGSSQMTLEFDVELNKFKWTIINIPLYSVVGANQTPQIVVKPINVGGGNYKIMNRMSGIVFSRLEPFESFWKDKLGFDGSVMTNYTLNVRTINTPNLENQGLPVIRTEDLVNTTGSFRGLDVAILKTNPSVAPAITSLTSTSLLQNSIYAQENLADNASNEPYYIIEVDMGFNNELVGQNVYKNKVSSIISRYYSSASFTSAYNEGSIPYTHRGENVSISSFKVRILNPDKRNSLTIKDNNTIYMEVSNNYS